MADVQHITQPQGSKLCAHSCVAMVLGISLEAACKRMGHRRGTHNRELIKALGRRAGARKSTRPPRDLSELPALCILRIQWKDRKHHVVLKNGRFVHDPLYAKPAPSLQAWLEFVAEHGGRLVSVISVKEEGS